jgi:sarcosine oxidase subunit beta
VLEKAEVVVIGGGVVGLSVAYNLVKRGVGKVSVLERRYLGSGASTRNCCGIRSQFGAEENIRLARESKKIFQGLTAELGFNILHIKGGCMMLASTPEEAEILERNVRLQNRLGVNTRLLNPGELRARFPYLNPDKIRAASFDPTDSKAHHDAVVMAYSEACRRLGVELNTYTEVKGFKVEGKAIRAVKTSRGEVKCSRVVNAAGVWSRQVARMAGVNLPNRPLRAEGMVTEPFHYFLDPTIVHLNGPLELTQTLRGELVGGLADGEDFSLNLNSSLSFAENFCKRAVEIFPRLKFANLMRQWAGYFDVTPDGSPVLGPAEEVENFFQANGFSGHGFTLAPVVGRLLAEVIAKGKATPSLEPFYPSRFREGKLIVENTAPVDRLSWASTLPEASSSAPSR